MKQEGPKTLEQLRVILKNKRFALKMLKGVSGSVSNLNETLTNQSSRLQSGRDVDANEMDMEFIDNNELCCMGERDRKNLASYTQEMIKTLADEIAENKKLLDAKADEDTLRTTKREEQALKERKRNLEVRKEN
jgi:hypothetical protein